MRGADFVLFMTEPTPFGLHDLKQVAAIARELGLWLSFRRRLPDLTSTAMIDDDATENPFNPRTAYEQPGDYR